MKRGIVRLVAGFVISLITSGCFLIGNTDESICLCTISIIDDPAYSSSSQKILAWQIWTEFDGVSGNGYPKPVGLPNKAPPTRLFIEKSFADFQHKNSDIERLGYLRSLDMECKPLTEINGEVQCEIKLR